MVQVVPAQNTLEEFKEFGLGRKHDEQSVDTRDWQIHRLFAANRVEIKRRPWQYYALPRGPRIDQGPTPQCTEYSFRNYAMSGPIMQPVKQPFGALYREAQTVDEWPGENYEGTSVRAMMKVAQRLGYLSNYAFATNLDEALDWVLGGFGPIILGTNWYEGMFKPDPKTKLIAPSGQIAGGHAYLLYGASATTRMGFILNSWGPYWGDNGTAKMSFETLARLISEDGEAATPTELRL